MGTPIKFTLGQEVSYTSYRDATVKTHILASSIRVVVAMSLEEATQIYYNNVSKSGILSVMNVEQVSAAYYEWFAGKAPSYVSDAAKHSMLVEDIEPVPPESNPSTTIHSVWVQP